jgi:WD40 repeat protein
VLPERGTPGDVADEVGSRELLRLVDEEIERLPAAVREPLILCCLQGRTRDEAAEALGCSVAAIKGRLERGRELLRRRLQLRGVQLPAALLALGLTSDQVRAALRAKALQSALGSVSPAVAALVPAAGASLTSKLTLTAMSLVMAGVLGFGAFHIMQAKQPQETPAPAKDFTPKSPQPPVAENPRPRLDRFGDPLPPGAIRRFGTLRFRYAGIDNLAFTPDSKRLITGIGTAPLAVFDAMTGRKLRTIGKSTPNNFGEFALSPDGKRIACCGSDVFVWALETGQLIRKLGCGRCQSVAFSPDGKKIAVVPEWRAEMVIVEAATGKHLAKWTVKKGWVNNFNVGQYDLRSIAFSSDGKFLAGDLSEWRKGEPFEFTPISSQVCVLDTAKGTLVSTIGSIDVPAHSPTFQPGNERLTTIGKDGIVRFWDMATGKEVQRFPVGKKGTATRGLSKLRFSADGRRCAVIMDGQPGTLVVLDARTGQELRRIEIGSTKGPVAVALSSDGTVVASGMLYNESCVRVWDVESGVERLADAGHRTAATLSLSADGRTLRSEGMDGRVIHWDLRTGKGEVRPSVRPSDMREETGHQVWPSGLPGDWFLRGPRWQLRYKTRTSMLEAWSLDGSKLLGETKWSDKLGRVTLSPDGAYMAYALLDLKSNPVLLWNPGRDKEPRRLVGHFGYGRDLLFTHDSKRLIVGVGPNNPNHVETIWIWDVAAAKIVRKLPTLTAPGQMVLTADDRFLITSDSGRVWDLETGRELTRLVKTKGAVENLFLSPNERFLAGIASEGLTVWETASWKLVHSFAESPSPHSMVFSRDGRSLFVANSDSTILEWDVSGQFGRKTKAPNQDRLNALWRTLTDAPDKAYPAAWEMLDHPAESVPFLIGKLSPVKPLNEQRVRQLLDQLDSESFAEREEASHQLLALGEQTLPMLRQALREGRSLETKKRVEAVIESLTCGPSPQQLRLLRALAVLEWSGTAEANEHLHRLAGGAGGASVTEAAKTALRRLGKR